MTSETHHLTHLSSLQRLKIQLLGSAFAFAFRTRYQKIIGIQYHTIFKWIPLWLMVAVLVFRWPRPLLWLFLATAVFIRIVYWQAKRQGYSRFIPDPSPHPLGSPAPLEANERILLRATGLFSLAHNEERIFLRPAEFWQVPLGERVIMVKTTRQNQFLYQFVEEDSIEEVTAGWLIFGRDPLPSLALTFCVKWGPGYDESTSFYYVGEEANHSPPPCQERTVYLTFEDESTMARVEANLASSKRLA